MLAHILTAAEQQDFCKIWGSVITAVNSDSLRTVTSSTENAAMQTDSSEETSTVAFLSNLINRVLRHTCGLYCLRAIKRQLNASKRCRFHYPRAYNYDDTIDSSSRINIIWNSRYLCFEDIRNNIDIILYIPVIIMT